jgi:hypothetical protein
MHAVEDSSTLRESLERMEGRLRCLECWMDRVEKQPAAPPPKKKDGWEKLQILSSMLTPIVTAVLGYFLITTVNLSLQKQQLQLSGAKEMQGLLADLGNPDATLEKTQASAMALASFGRFAVIPLINELQARTFNGQLAAQVGLRAIGAEDQKETCRELQKTVENRSRLYGWIAHRYAIRLLGEVGCREAIPSLLSYKQLLGSNTEDSVKAYAKVVSDDVPPTLESLNNLKDEVDRSLEILQRISH